jgi:hypothetical protein
MTDDSATQSPSRDSYHEYSNLEISERNEKTSFQNLKNKSRKSGVMRFAP